MDCQPTQPLYLPLCRPFNCIAHSTHETVPVFQKDSRHKQIIPLAHLAILFSRWLIWTHRQTTKICTLTQHPTSTHNWARTFPGYTSVQHSSASVPGRSDLLTTDSRRYLCILVYGRALTQSPIPFCRTTLQLPSSPWSYDRQPWHRQHKMQERDLRSLSCILFSSFALASEC